MQEKRDESLRALTSAENNAMDGIDAYYLTDENQLVEGLLAQRQENNNTQHQIQQLARELVLGMRKNLNHASGLHALLQHYDLSTQEGVVLMCLAEALLRIPDTATVDELIADKLAPANWQQHLGQSDSLFVNASTWALMLSGRFLQHSELSEHLVDKLFSRLEGPVLRIAIRHAMRLVAEQFVMGADINMALSRAAQPGNNEYLHSFDMLGEAALTTADAQRYQQAYLNAIDAIGQHVDADIPILQRPGISVKLSALYPRYEFSQQQAAVNVLTTRLLELSQRAKDVGICLTVDAEEADRLTLSLRIFEQVFLHPSLRAWRGLGLAVQAYQKRALPVLKFLCELAKHGERQIPVRLVKGAYWDTEIKRAQQQGLSDYPVFTRKNNTDVSYLACAQFLLAESAWLYPQFATHNAYTVASILIHGASCEYEFQRLHGMGEALYEAVLDDARFGQNGVETCRSKVRCRVYAPVGAHKELLPYLVRRLLENGANSSFVNQLAHMDQSLDELTLDPWQVAMASVDGWRHPSIALPVNLFGEERINSKGINFSNLAELNSLLLAVGEIATGSFESRPCIGGQDVGRHAQSVINPAHQSEIIGCSSLLDVTECDEIERALSMACQDWPQWNATEVKERARVLIAAADLFEAHQAELITLCIKEAGKTLSDSHAEIREAVDFLRYYAHLANLQMGQTQMLAGSTGESNELSLHGRGVFVCISPWNFPVAIFAGQVAAALVTGNSVLAKPASSTCLVSRRVIELFYQAGVPSSVLHYIPCNSALLSERVLTDERVAGVVFTGSLDTARHINQRLAQRDGAIATLIAETGGQNVLVADSTAQPEQLVTDIIRSAFNSAGQRCSALRVLYVQEEIAERVIELLKGAMEQLVISDPLDIATDIGPVISAQAQQALEQHVAYWQQKLGLLYRCKLKADCDEGHFVAPTLIEIDGIEQLSKEIFGPILHLVRYKKADLNAVLDAVNATGYGLTFGLHSRLDNRINLIQKKIRAGNLYVNRDTIGAVVGVQPFGGQGLSGTGPKAGGPHYLHRFTTEQVCTVNTAAAGGNASLLSQIK